MRIIKYLFLLLLLSLVALTIFAATQKGEFTIERSCIINSPRATVFSYVSDSKNWKSWNSWAVDDSLISITQYKNAPTEKGFQLSWDGNKGNGDLENIINKLNESITQKINFNGNSSEATMHFKDTLKGTKITWKATVKLGFVNKIITTFNGAFENEITSMFEKSLANLDRKLDFEVNHYSVKLDGVTIKPACFYLEQTFTSEFTKVRKNAEIVFNKITKFCKQNKIIISGKPFIIYHNYDTESPYTKISICIPIKQEIFITEGSEIMSRKIISYPVVKTTLTGDYTHTEKALEKANNFIKEKRYIKNTLYSHFEVFVIDKSKTNSPSKWITEIYIPIHPKGISKSLTTVTETVQDSVQ
ncbi:SRPBCC family protein [Flavobacterium sp.]|uniref:SRPBCC family protein n=1 Tax=Flavobacterium sp. TaxID=239 RepID=UPI0038FCAE7D